MKQAEKEETMGPAKETTSAKPDPIAEIHVMGLERWDSSWMSRQSMSAALNQFVRTIYTGQPKYPTKIRDLFTLPKRRVEDGVRIQELPCWMNTHFEDVHRHRWLSHQIKRRILYSNFMKRTRALLVYHPTLVSYLDTLSADVACYYVVDFFEGLAVEQDRMQTLRQQEQRLLDKADVIFVTWKGLAEKLGIQDKAILLPHGMNFEYYNRASRNEFPVPSDIPRGRPIVGYTGSIKTKTDFELLEKLTARLTDWNVVLMGHKSVEEPEDRKRFENLLQQPNFFHLGLKAYHELGAYLQSFDVCMMCYTINAWTEYGLPLKMFEYFATGKPVVSTYLPSLDEYRDYVTVCSNHDEFITAVAEQKTIDTPERQQTRIDFASRNTWTHRAQTILKVLTEAIDKKS